jgi:hypothetical protein
MDDTLSTHWATRHAALVSALLVLTRTLVTAVLLLGAAACGGKDTLPTRPSPMPSARSQPAPAPATDIAGDYQLTVTASSSCTFRAPLMKRIYRANVKAWVDYQYVAVDVSGGSFFRDWATGFDGTRDGDTVSFRIVGIPTDDFLGYFYDYGLAELIDGTELLTYDGKAVATIRGSSITGDLDGRISLLDYATRAVLAECRATDHKLDFVR